VCLYAAWNARDLVMAWHHSPFDRQGWIAFIIWTAPILLQGCRGRWSANGYLFGLALGVSLVGVIFDLNAVKYAGLALACGGFFPYRTTLLLFWLACSVSWMPALGWMLSFMGALTVNLIRLVVAALPFGADR